MQIRHDHNRIDFLCRRAGRKAVLPAVFFLTVFCLGGCGRIVFTSGLDRDELFTVGDQSGSVRELNIYLVTMENQYKETFGSDVFTRTGNETVGETLKGNALERLTKVKALNQIADTLGTSADETEESRARQKAEDYLATLSDADRAYLNPTESLVTEMYLQMSLASKTADQLISDVSREVSDDEARTVTVQSILIKTYRTDADGNRVEFTDAEKEEARQRAVSIRNEIQEGMDNLRGITFDTWIAEYNEDSTSTYTFGRGEVDSNFENAAFNLEVGKISDVIETADGYRIIKCISISDQDTIDANKEAILEARLSEAYEKAYDSYADELDVSLNEDRWNDVALCEDPEVTTDQFFEIYSQ